MQPFTTQKSKNTGLIAAILIAAVLISGSLVFLGMRSGLSKDDVKTAVISGLNDFVKNGPDAAGGGGEPTPTVVEGDYTDGGAVLGSKDAAVTIVEFSDFQCPYCEKFYSGAYQDIKKNYIDTGKVKLVFRNFPLDGHPGAYPAALAAECARDQGGDEMFFKMHNILFENQGVLGGAADAVKTALLGFAKELGVDATKYTKCVESDKFKDQINADLAAAQKAGIGGTPSFIVNGTVLVGAQPYETFQQTIDEALAK